MVDGLSTWVTESDEGEHSGKKHTLGKQQVAMQDPNRTFHDAGKAESH